ncbi:ATP-dependent protease La [Choanephora cucurbitarum]|nr:ATP-dependent protease La [Choanephora cucurbitarum]
MNYPDKLVIVPLDNKVLLPSVVLRLLIHGKQASELAKLYFRQQNKSIRQDIYVACIPLRPKHLTAQPSESKDEAPSTQAPQVPMTPQTIVVSKPTSNGVLVSLEDKHRLLPYGCLARIVRVQRSGTDLFGVYVEGIERFKVDDLIQNTSTMPFPGYWTVHTIYPMAQETRATTEIQLKELSQAFIAKMKGLQLPESLLNPLHKAIQTMQVSLLADLLVSLIETTFEERWDMLSNFDLNQRLEKACLYLTRQLHVLQISDNLGLGIDGRLSRHQREFYLRQQLESIQSEPKDVLNSIKPVQVSEEDELSELHRRLAQAQLPKDVVTVAQREFQRIKKLQPASSEWAVSRNYLEWLSELPWNISTPTSTIHLQRAKKQLDEDHFGLVHVKKRIMEYLSVIKIKDDLKAPIVCLVGPPGVGKTSLGRSIAQCMSRQFHRVSLGGVRDEADIRGHRRTYVGAMPGLIIQGLRKCKVNNPLFLLDEIDKLAHGTHHGDPAAALLEVLDPEQNSSFADHYLNVGFDLSQVLFLATANSLDTIPEPLLDRMEVIELQGYTIQEKLHIAKTHLIPKQVAAHGLGLDQIQWTETEAIVRLIEQYTREAGVRQLERTIASVIRYKCVELTELKEHDREAEYDAVIQPHHIEAILGPVRFEKEVTERQSQPGVVTGLAYSGSGQGGILFVEASRMPGEGRLELTGSLGHVIQESAKLALSWVKSNAYVLQLTTNPKERLVEQDDIHIHFPSGSIPKDGPSAGITLVCAIVSLYSNRCIPTTTAMTGEISLRGQLLPVGGIKEKIISAHRAGIRKVILPIKNKRDVENDLPQVVCQEIEICYANTIWEVLASAFEYSIASHRLLESHL